MKEVNIFEPLPLSLCISVEMIFPTLKKNSMNWNEYRYHEKTTKTKHTSGKLPFDAWICCNQSNASYKTFCSI